MKIVKPDILLLKIRYQARLQKVNYAAIIILRLYLITAKPEEY